MKITKEDAEDKAILDHKPEEDTLGELRHTKKYEETVELEHILKILPFTKIESISHTFIDKITHSQRPRSNSIQFL